MPTPALMPMASEMVNAWAMAPISTPPTKWPRPFTKPWDPMMRPRISAGEDSSRMVLCMTLNPDWPMPAHSRTRKDTANQGDHATTATPIPTTSAPMTKYRPWNVYLERPPMMMAPINAPMPSAAPRMPPRAGPTFKTSVATTGMKYCRGRIMPFITSDMVRTPSTNLLEKEWPIPDLMPDQKAVSLTIRAEPSGRRILNIRKTAIRSSATNTINAPVKP